MIEVYALKIDTTINSEVYEQLLLYVDEEKRLRLKRFRFIEDGKRSLYGDLMVRWVICMQLKMLNKDIEFEYNQYGKPFLKNYPNFYFNISHSGNWVVCATSNKEVGIDVEQVNNINFDIAKRFFSQIEYQTIMMQPESLRLESFYDFWTLKESFIKCIGKGLSIPLNSFYIKCDESSIDIFPVMKPALNLYRIFLDKGYKLAICSEDKINYKIRFMSINNIKEKFLYEY